ncbi:hypothetical protein [Bacillus marinisedimentorum]|uniref:hypothetical protein n=1 Tax=Bacillus marinisedimentorum TaxID=1821260 RepID=UPI0007E235DD|nr:hypothetical protein [Bacillus marinisedimentorum]
MKILINIIIMILILAAALLLSQLLQKIFKSSNKNTEIINYLFIGIIATGLWAIIGDEYEWFVFIIGLAGYTISLYYLILSKVRKKQ